MSHSNEKQIQRLAQLIGSTAAESESTFTFEVTSMIMCGDCGVSQTSRNVCQWCGGYAQPAPNTLLARKFKVV